jgi:GAF domain-containing protein
MPQAELEANSIDHKQEAARLAALNSSGILDTAPEPSYDAITRLSAEYFQAEVALLGFVDETRIWIKSHWGEDVRELPRNNSIFEMVLDEDGPLVIPDLSQHPRFQGHRLLIRRFAVAFFAGVPVRSRSGKILGVLTIFCRHPRAALAPDEIEMFENLADMVASQLELHKQQPSLPYPDRPGRAFQICAAPWTSASLCSTTNLKSISPPAKSSASRRSSAGRILNAGLSRLWTSSPWPRSAA